MLSNPDNRALRSIADTLADAIRVYRKAASIAADQRLAERLAAKESELRELSDIVSPAEDQAEGSLAGRLDRFRLRIGSMLGDEDEAAAVASDEARSKVVDLADALLADPDVSAGVKNLIEEVRFRLGGSRAGEGGETSFDT